jgi:murein DD-endopeptidase MepM/ murein hydrolase activator NlpD
MNSLEFLIGLQPASLVPYFFGIIVVVAGCNVLALRPVTPTNAPPNISHLFSTDTRAHSGITIGGRGYLGHEIVAAADGVVVFVHYGERAGYHVRIHHALDIDRRDIYTEYFHVYEHVVKEGDQVKRGQTIGSIGRRGARGGLRRVLDQHYHYLVVYGAERPGNYSPADPHNYWFGIDQYKVELEKGLDIGHS